MSKFNKPVPPRVPDTRTAEGGAGFTRSPKEELFVLGLANMVGEDTFYETGASRDARFENLVQACAQIDPEWTAKFIAWLRSAGNMRSAPIVAAAEYVKAGAPHGRQVVASVLQRPDEPAELLGYWGSKHGKVRRPPKPIARGIGDALGRLYTERNVMKYDGQGNAIRFGDVVDIVHPSPVDDHQSRLFRHLIDRRHGRVGLSLGDGLETLFADRCLMEMPENERRANLHLAVECGWPWERIAGWVPGGMDAQVWEAAIPNMGLMAIVKNLRNFDEAGISNEARLEVTRRLMDEEEVRKSRQFPLRFLSAWKAISSVHWGMGLEAALNHSLGNVPYLPGRTLVLVDVSPSMRDLALSRRKDGRVNPAITPRRWEVAGVFGAAIAQRAQDAKVVLFDFNPVATAKMNKADSVLRFVEQCGEWANKSNGTDILRSLADTYDGHDRVIILTDEQNGYGPTRGPAQYWYADRGIEREYRRAGWDEVAHIKVPVFTFNLGGYKNGVTPNERNWHTFGGLSDACFGLIPILERRRAGDWPWDVAVPMEVVEAD